jgi:phosphatidyl-myo-inositol alpha-mannosyltransferase
MKIAHVSPYDHQTAGGVREHVVNLDRQFRAMGHDVTIIAPASRRTGLAPNVICISDWVVPVPGSGSIARISLSPFVYRRIKRILVEGNFDVVHLHEPLMPVVTLFALWHSPTVTIGTIHGYRERYIVYRALQPLLRRLMDRLAARTAVSTDARAWAAQYFPGEYHLISDGVDVERFGDPTLLPIPSPADGQATILFVGRLEDRKGFPYLLQAFPAVKRVVPEARLVVVGDYSPAQAQPYREYARRHGLRDIDFVGYVDAGDLPRYYRSANVFCAPSTGFEALGIVLLEAMASGTPIVTTNIEGYRTVVTSGQDGLVVPPRDPAALAQAIITLLQDPELARRLAARGCETVQRYAWPTIARRLIHLYEACLAARGDPAP